MTRDLNDAEPILQEKYLLAINHFKRIRWIRHRFDIRISCVLRTDEEQKDLYWKSRYITFGTGNIKQKIGVRHVTYADGVRNKSRHQPNAEGKSEAIDFFVVRKKTGRADWLCRVPYSIFGRLCRLQGLEWGGDWKFQDRCHVQLIKS